MITLTINNQDLGGIATIDTYTMFTGSAVDDALISFYNDEHGTDYGYNQFEWSYDHKAIVRDLAECSREWLVENVLGEIVLEIGEILHTSSPKEYNFQTDSWDAEWKVDENALQAYVNSDSADYAKWYKKSGWAEHTDWREEHDLRKTENKVCAMLEYYLSQEFDVSDYEAFMYDREFDIYCEHTNMECLEEDTKEEQGNE